MKKILFVTTRNPYSNKHSGDRLRATSIINHLSNKNDIEVVYLDTHKNIKKEFKNKGKIELTPFHNNLLTKIFFIFLSFFKLEPLQNGFFYSSQMKKYINLNQNKYKTIICHLIRSAQYLPKNFKGKKILEMTDVYSYNYSQTLKNISFFNPLYIIYLIEYFFVKKYENKINIKFNKIVIVSKRDLAGQGLKKNNKKFVVIPNGCSINQKKYKFKKNNKNILFIGNLKYLPNIQACFYFVKKILPKIKTIYPEINFLIIGEISHKNKIILNSYKNVKALGEKIKLEKYINKSICGIANLNIATGFQNKILTYMSYGLPVISNSLSFSGIRYLKKNLHIFSYSSTYQFIQKFKILKNNKNIANKISISAYKIIKKKFSWNKTLSNYLKII